MAFPILPVAGAGVAALAVFLLTRHAKASPASPSPSSPAAKPGAKLPPAPAAPSPSTGEELPPELKSLYEQLLNKGTDADAIDVVADKFYEYGFPLHAAALHKRAAQLRAMPKPAPVPEPRPTPSAPPPPPPPSPSAPPPPGSKALCDYKPDLRPMSDAGAYYYDPSNGKHAAINVREDAKALRFLGLYLAKSGDPGGGNGLSADRNSATGSWYPPLQLSVKQFQTDMGLTADGWLGPQTRKRLGEEVAQINASRAAENAQNGVPNAVFSGYSGYGLAIGAVKEHTVRVRSPGGLRIRRAPSHSAPTIDTLPRGGHATLLLAKAGPKLERSAPGPGGWSLVDTGTSKGWALSEWLEIVQ